MGQLPESRAIGVRLGRPVRCIPSSAEGVVAIAVFYAYCDESGIHKGAKYCSVCGFIAGPEAWRVFIRKWRAALKRAGIDSFHAKDIIGSGRQTDTARIAAAINPKKILAIGTTVNIQDFMAETVGVRRFLTGATWRNGRWRSSGAPSRPYFAAFIEVLVECLGSVTSKDRVHFIFDQQNLFEGHAKESYAHAMKILPDDATKRMGSISFEDKKRFLPLQAADLLAYSWNAYADATDQKKSLSREIGTIKDHLLSQKEGMRYSDWRHIQHRLGALPEERRLAIVSRSSM